MTSSFAIVSYFRGSIERPPAKVNTRRIAGGYNYRTNDPGANADGTCDTGLDPGRHKCVLSSDHRKRD
jgi:hypothetical protein